VCEEKDRDPDGRCCKASDKDEKTFKCPIKECKDFERDAKGKCPVKKKEEPTCEEDEKDEDGKCPETEKIDKTE